ncbi:MAG: hypothetical protein QOD29_3242 [Alphaproteobacteria bacterium]|nr:hypothetical protein [Alphaproteobacteria bacterium]
MQAYEDLVEQAKNGLENSPQELACPPYICIERTWMLEVSFHMDQIFRICLADAAFTLGGF